MPVQLANNNSKKLSLTIFLAILFTVIMVLWIALNFYSPNKTISSAEIKEHSDTPSPNSDAENSVLGKESDASDIKSQVAQFAEKLHAIQSPETEQLISKGDALVKEADHLLLKMAATEQSAEKKGSERSATPK